MTFTMINPGCKTKQGNPSKNRIAQYNHEDPVLEDQGSIASHGFRTEELVMSRDNLDRARSCD